MVIFHREIQIESNRQSKKELTLKIEQEIKNLHAHSDGSPVSISIVEESKIESILNNAEMTKKYKKSELEPKISGMYNNTRKFHSPVFICSCGRGFSALKSQNNLNIYEIPNYTSQESSSEQYSAREEINNGYNQPSYYR